MVFIMIVFLAIPIVTTSAQNAMKGDPVIICVSSELIRAKERTARTEDASFGDIIFHLDVQLKAVKHFTSTANATLRFKDIASLDVEQTMTGEKNEPKILRNQANWNAIKRGKTQSTVLPFKIAGFQRLPEKMEFELDIAYKNPNDEELYFKTLTLNPLIQSATVDIKSITNPPDRSKGDNVPLSITVKNIGTEYAYGLTIKIKVKSIGAGTSTSNPYVNSNGAIVLLSEKLVSEDMIAPNTQLTFNYNIPCTGYSNGAMNHGTWKIIGVEAYSYNSPSDIISENDPIISDPQYKVTTKTKRNGPHAVFIYYTWNSGGTGDNWAGDNPKDYFVDGYGGCKAGLHCFSGSYGLSVKINPIIAFDDNTWSIPNGVYDGATIRENGVDHVESKLSISYWWRYISGVSRRNCGFDIILMASGRRGDVAGTSSHNTILVSKWRYGLPSATEKWRSNIDGLVQHELSHQFGCDDVAQGHAKVNCIMAYWTNWIGYPISFLYEYMNWGAGLQTGWWYFACSCNSYFDTNWGKFYTVDTS